MLSKTKISNRTATYFTTFISLGLMSASLGPTLPGLAAHASVNMSAVSILFPAKSIGVMIGSFFVGRLYDRMPAHRLMAIVLFLMAILLAFIPDISMIWFMAGAMLVLGITEGALDVGGNTLMVWEHGNKVAPYMNGLHFFFGLGAFISPVIVAQALETTKDINLAYWILAGLFLPIAILIFRLPNPPARKAVKEGEGAKADVILMALVASFLFLFVGAEASFGSWIYTFAAASGIGTATTSAYLTSCFWGALTLGRLVSIPLATRYKTSTILLIDLICGIISVGFVLAFPGSQLAVWVGTFLTGFAFASIFPTMYSLAGSHMVITGKVTGWLFIGAGAGGMVLPWIIGQLFESIGPWVTIAAIFIDIVIATGVFLTLLALLKRREVKTRPVLEAE